jgi:hypothetical protein
MLALPIVVVVDEVVDEEVFQTDSSTCIRVTRKTGLVADLHHKVNLIKIFPK